MSEDRDMQTAGTVGDIDPVEDLDAEYLEDEDLDDEDDDKPVSFGRWLGELLLMVAIAFLLATGIRTFIVQPYVVPTGSMIPTIELQDRIIANKFIYRFREPAAGEVVVLDDPTGNVQTLVKRVIATEGQTVNFVDGQVVVDGVVLDEPYTHGLPTQAMTLEMPYTVPEDSVWLMGDNRTNSADSRVFGAVSLSEIRGEAIFTYWPIDRMGAL